MSPPVGIVTPNQYIDNRLPQQKMFKSDGFNQAPTP